MSFLTPMVGLIAAAIAVPALVILYFLKLRRKDVEVSSTLLWRKAIQDMQANAPFQKLRRNILLVLQLLALGAALFAVAQPQLSGDAGRGARHVILIDRSGSMNAVDEELGDSTPATRLARAKELALGVVEGLREPNVLVRTVRGEGERDQAMVIAFDTTAQAVQAFTSDKAALRRAIESIEPTDGPTSVEEAFRLVRAQAPRRFVPEDRPGVTAVYEKPAGGVGTIHLFTDGRAPDLAKADLSPEDVVLYHRVGKTTTPNVAITGLRATRSIEAPGKLSVFVGLQTTETAPRTVDVELQVDGRVVRIEAVRLEAARTETLPGAAGADGAEGAVVTRVVPQPGGTVFTLDRPEGGIVTVHVGSPVDDVFKDDDTAHVVAPPSRSLSAAVVTRGNLFLRDALGGLPLARLDVLSPEQFEAARRRPGGTGHDVVVLDGVLPAGDDGKPLPSLPAGRYLIFNAVPAPLVAGGVAEGPVVLDWVRNHPAMRDLTLDALLLARARRVEIPAGAAARAVATADSGPLVAELIAGEARALVVPFDVAESNWGFDLSFVVFMANAVEWLGDDAAGVDRSLSPGGVWRDRLPGGAADVRVRLPGGRTEGLGEPSPAGEVVFGPVRRAGVYQVSWSGPPGPRDARQGDRAVRAFAANLLNPSESDVAAAASLSLPTVVARAEEAEGVRAPTALWPALLLAVLAALLLEWWVYNRRVQV